MTRSRISALAIVALALAGCSASPAPIADEPAALPSQEAAAPAPAPAADIVGDGCALLDDDYLDTALADVESTFGGPLDFRAHDQIAPSAFCSWKDVSGGLSIQIKLEDAATSEIDDHTGRAYNIDSDPVVEPQDGPGQNAVVLVDNAFADVRGEGFAYGYFFVDSGVTVFLTTPGLEIGRDMLRVLADEAHARLMGQ
jgi:hypothetical protein